MNKTDLINIIAEKTELSKTDTKKVLDMFAEVIEKELKKGGKVNMVGFGSFSVFEKAPRKGVIPKTKTPIMIPSKKVVKFKPGSNLHLEI